jgi:L-erythro-3,5-diaminohexanoate dehydrogenase
MRPRGSPYGVHRSLAPAGELPQAAWRLDNRADLWSNEALIEVEALNVDSASFRDLRERSTALGRGIEELIAGIVAERGKLHNPATDSGGMLIGRVAAVGEELARRGHPKVGDRIATMVSLTLTPLALARAGPVHQEAGRVEVEGHAILFETGLYAHLPADLPERLACAVLDVAGAPALMRELVRPGALVLVLGAGKAGLLALEEARRARAGGGRVVAVEADPAQAARVRELDLADRVIELDCTRPLAAYDGILDATGGRHADLTFNVVNVAGTETLSILATADGGEIVFFSMATSFQRAALMAEGLGRDVRMRIGSGYTRGWVDVALGCVRGNAALRGYLESKYAGAGSTEGTA